MPVYHQRNRIHSYEDYQGEDPFPHIGTLDYFVTTGTAPHSGHRSGVARRSWLQMWWFAIVAFALITVGAVSNEFHGRPPVALHLVIGWWSASLLLAIVGLYLEISQDRTADQA